MKDYKLLSFFILFFFIVVSNIWSKDIIYSNIHTKLKLGDGLEILEDKSGTMLTEDVVKSKNFKLVHQEIPNLGISSNSFWIKFKLVNQTPIDSLLLELAQPFIDDIELYSFEHGQITLLGKGGDKYPFIDKIYAHQNHIFNLVQTSKTSKEYYLKVKSGELILVPLSIGTLKSFFETSHNSDIIFGLYCGIIFGIFFYNLFLYFTIKDSLYLYYVIYIMLIGLTQAAILGYPSQYLWSESPQIANLSVYILPCFVSISALEFIKRFLNTKETIPLLHQYSKIITLAYILTGLLALMGYYNFSYFLVLSCAAIISVYMLIMGIMVFKIGNKSAKFFLIGWSMLLIGIIIFVLKDFGLLPNNIFTTYTMPAGSAIEVILLSFALADRINILKKEKEASQLEAINALKENEKIIKEQNIILDEKVKERTHELQEAMEELSITLSNLKETQSQLVESEKMASLGVLTAGIAHEINNPINFVGSSVNPLKRDVEFLLTLVDKYNKQSTHSEVAPHFKEIHAWEDRLDIPYLKEEIETIIKGIEEGASRTKEIVKGLRDFSRLDEEDIKSINLHVGLDSTLIILNNKISKIEVIKNYGVIPEVECFGGKINQVFMNILSNAIDALDNVKDGRNKTLAISTQQDEKNVYISIKDNAMGIPEDVKKKIFEPFYTTKEVGKGTGLGLSIVHKIIENHKGTITVESELSKGTEFLIVLPKVRA